MTQVARESEAGPFIVNTMAMATTAGTSTPSPLPLPSTASTLWARVLDLHGPSNAITAQLPSHAQFTPQDKTGTSTRMLLHDTHARLEIFSERANSVFSEIEASKREMLRLREEVESAREMELDTIAQLSTLCFFFPRIYARLSLNICISQPMSVVSPKDDRRACANA